MTKPVLQLFDLSSRVAIVTGGSRGLGLEMAEGLAEAGASLMLCARREQWLTPAIDAMRARGFRVEGSVCDVSNPQHVDNVVSTTIEKLGRIDILVNNAGVSWGEAPETMPLEQWKRVLDTNLTGAFLFSQAAGRHMLKARSGNIINVASVAGLRSSVKGPHYAGLRGEQGRPHGIDARAGGVVGTARHPRQRDRSRIFSFAPRRSGDRVSSSLRSRSAIRFLASAKRGSSKASQCFWRRTRRATSPDRSSPSMAARLSCDGGSVTERSPYAAKPWTAHYDYWVQPHMNYPRRPLGDILRLAAADVPDAPATAFLGARLTWAEIKDRSDKLATALARKGIGKGDRVGIMLPNCPQYLIAAFAILRIGGIVVNINPLYTPREIVVVAADSGMRLLITLDVLAPQALAVRDQTSIEAILITSAAEYSAGRGAVSGDRRNATAERRPGERQRS